MIADKRLIYTTPDGITAIVIPSPDYTGTAAQLAEHLGLGAHKVVDASDIPADRTFRNALKYDLKHDMVKAREILKEKIRNRRAPLFAALDTEYMKADEANDTQKKNEVKAQKQALRDATALPAIASATTTAQLKAAWPVDLLGAL